MNIASDRPRIVVLHSIAPPDGTTQFADQMADGAPPEVEVRFFSWKTALQGGYDIFHVHWPERLLRRGVIRTVLLLLVLRLRRVPIVRTLHNITPHEKGRAFEGFFLRWIDRNTSFFIKLNATTTLPIKRPSAVVLLGHYRDRFAGFHETAPIPGRILFFGIIRPYKGVETLLEAFEAVPDKTTSLRIIGSAKGDRGEAVREACARDARISARLEFLPDADLIAEIRQAELTVFPYREMHNSGALLLALSLERPALAPFTSANDAIADEVGHDWLMQYRGGLSAECLSQALAASRHVRQTPAPDMEERAWPVIGEQLYQAYIDVLISNRVRRNE